MITNRIVHLQADYIFRIIRKPNGWRPHQFDQAPSTGHLLACEIISEDFVASYAEARDDLMRFNGQVLTHGLDQWAMIVAPSGGL
jgi:hypothetical protein